MSVCVATPTRNRRWTQDWSLSCLKTQDYKEPITHIVVDNSDTPEMGWDTPHRIEGGQKPIGWMRNKCIELFLQTDCEFLVFWDDDDYYPPTRISSGVEALQANPSVHISASSDMLLLITHANILVSIASHGDTHGTAATYTIRRTYVETHTFTDTHKKGEEAFFTDYWKQPIIQIPTEKTIVVMGHSSNTFPKTFILSNPSLFRATILDANNGARAFRARFPAVDWDLFRTTFSV